MTKNRRLITALAPLAVSCASSAAPLPDAAFADGSSTGAPSVTCKVTNDASVPTATRPLAFWSEYLTDDQVRAALPLLASKGVDLYLAIHAERIGDPSLTALLCDARAAGVGVRAWMLLNESDGYWANEHNVDKVRATAMALADWRDKANLPFDWIIFDMEMSLERTKAFGDAVKQGGLTGALSLVKQGDDMAAFKTARERYVKLVDDMHNRGLKVMSVSYPFVLDDAADGDDQIQDRFDVPIGGVPWDEASFMVYQSTFYDYLGQWPSPELVYSYAASAREQFGDRAALALGIVGSVGAVPVNKPYPDAATLMQDEAAALAGGTARLSVYSLDGTLMQASPTEWLASPVPAKPSSAGTAALRTLAASLLDN